MTLTRRQLGGKKSAKTRKQKYGNDCFREMGRLGGNPVLTMPKEKEVSDRDWQRVEVDRNLITYKINYTHEGWAELRMTEQPYVPSDWDGKPIVIDKGESPLGAFEKAGYKGDLIKLTLKGVPDQVDKTIREVQFLDWLWEVAKLRRKMEEKEEEIEKRKSK